MKKLVLCLILTLVFAGFVSKKSAFSYAADSDEQKKEVLISATFFDETGRSLGTMRALPKNPKIEGVFIPIPRGAKSFHMEISGFMSSFLLEELDGTSLMIECPKFMGFVDLYESKHGHYLFVFR